MQWVVWNGLPSHRYNEAGEILGPAELFFPMLEYPEFDFTFFHPKTLPLVERILGGREVPRVRLKMCVFWSNISSAPSG
eukprot:COSAG01_NODE_2823_length_7006_cov_12.699146_3_plen_79_part_00